MNLNALLAGRMTAGDEDDILFLEVANVTNLFLIDLIFLTHGLATSSPTNFLVITVLTSETMFSDLIALAEHFYLF